MTAKKDGVGHSLGDSILSIVKIQSITGRNMNPYVKEGVSESNIDRANELALETFWHCTNIAEQYQNGKTYSLESGVLGSDFSDKTRSINSEDYER